MSGGYTEDEIRRAADTREWLIKQIADRQEEIERLRTTLSLIDGLLKQGSFRAAVSLGAFAAGSPATAQVQQARPAPPNQQQVVAAPVLRSSDGGEIRQLKRAKDDFVLGSAEVNPTSVTIVPSQEITLNANTPPFRSFFLGRILEGMKTKDAEKVAQGAMKESDALIYRVEEEDGGSGNIKRIVIENYREKERLQEIFNTSSWVFTRMLEKSSA